MVLVILLIVYRSPVLWFFPLLAAGMSSRWRAVVVYLLAKNDVITLNGQSQGILSVLVIGAGTDYALLLIARYREELHRHERPLRRDDARLAGRRPGHRRLRRAPSSSACSACCCPSLNSNRASARSAPSASPPPCW